MRFRFASLAVTALLLQAGELQAQSLLTTNTIVGGTTINFSSLPSAVLLSSATIGGVTVTPVVDNAFYSIGAYGLLNNGTWIDAGAGAIGVGTALQAGSFLRFTFANAVGAAGGFVNYCAPIGLGCNGNEARMIAYDSGFNIIASYNVDLFAPINTPGALNAGAFRGIDGGGQQIKYLDWGGEFVAMGDLTYGDSNTVVPEPASIALVAAGLVMLGVVGRKRRLTATW